MKRLAAGAARRCCGKRMSLKVADVAAELCSSFACNETPTARCAGRRRRAACRRTNQGKVKVLEGKVHSCTA